MGLQPADCANPDSDGHLTIEAKRSRFTRALMTSNVLRERATVHCVRRGSFRTRAKSRTRDAVTLKLIAADKLHVVTEDGHTYHRCRDRRK